MYIFIICCILAILFLLFTILLFKRPSVKSKVFGIFFLLLTLCFVCGAVLFPPHDTISSTGPYTYQSARFELTEPIEDIYRGDGSSRKISFHVYYPEHITVPKSCPLVLFSHGGISIDTQNETLYHELASHGYVVVSINHTDMCLYTKVDGKTMLLNRGYQQELRREDAKNNASQSYTYYKKWMGIMMGDINYVIDHIKKNDTLTKSITNLIDTKKIIVMGHSLGGSAALGIGRTRKDITAAIALESPYLYDITDYKGGKFVWNKKSYPIPVLNIYTDSSFTHLQEWPQYKQNSNYYNSDNSKIKNVRMLDCGHFSITDLSLTSPVLTRLFNGFSSKKSSKECLKEVNQECLKFLEPLTKKE